MRSMIVVLGFLFITTAVYADWYVFDEETNRASSRTQYEPDASDLASRDQFAIKSDKDIPLHLAEFFNNDVRQRPLSQVEQNDIKAVSDEGAEMAEIYHVMFEMAYKEAVKRGKTFKKMDKHVDNINVVTETAQDEKVIEDELKDKTIVELKAQGKSFKRLKEKEQP